MTDPVPTAQLLVDLSALESNYQAISSQVAGEVGAVVKANAYGLGLESVARLLQQAGCQTFFTAFTHEAIALRSVLPDAQIYVFSPQISREAAQLVTHRLKPCIYDVSDIAVFCEAARQSDVKLKAALHFETGINRLGIPFQKAEELADENRWDAIEVDLVMSHLACADEPDHSLNREQLQRFQQVRSAFGDVPASLANSGGVFLGPEYHFDLVRPGIALFGHDPHYRSVPSRVQPVASLQAPLGQVKTLEAGESVGYGATVTCGGATTVGVVLAGYADGIPRILTEPGTVHHVVIAGQRVPLIGRASMDLITADLTELDTSVLEMGARVEVFGNQIAIEEAAEKAGTIPYELLTGIGSRVERVYLQADD